MEPRLDDWLTTKPYGTRYDQHDIRLDDVMLGSGGWGCLRRVFYGEHWGKAHCGEHHQSDGYGWIITSLRICVIAIARD